MRTLIALAALVLSACATTSGLAPTETRSGYDGARVVTVSPHGGACTSLPCLMLGAQWNDKSPDRAIITVNLHGEWKPVTSARLMIDGKEHALQPTPGLTTFNPVGQGWRESSRSFGASLAMVRSLSTADRAWLRVGTPEGTMEVAIVDGGTDSKALHAMRRFLAQVDGARP